MNITTLFFPFAIVFDFIFPCNNPNSTFINKLTYYDNDDLYLFDDYYNFWDTPLKNILFDDDNDEIIN